MLIEKRSHATISFTAWLLIADTFVVEQSRLSYKSPVELFDWTLTLVGNGEEEWRHNTTPQGLAFPEGITRPFGEASVTDGMPCI